MATQKPGKIVSTRKQLPLKSIQAQRLSNAAGISKDEIEGLNIAEISEKFRFDFDLTLLFFRKVCGQVVKTDPDTGIQHPVPFATVHVEDTDCNLLSYAPINSPYIWYFPLACQREVIATAVTDECGRFCVNIPRWDIDWILKWRRQRICFPDILIKPSIKDFLDDLIPRVPDIFPPGPDPVPWEFDIDRAVLDRARDTLGNSTVERIQQFHDDAAFGQSTEQLQIFLETPAFSKSLPPPLPDDISNNAQVCGKANDFARMSKDAIQLISNEIKTTPEVLKSLNRLQLDRFIGPFRRCFDIFVPQWTMINDIPDITFLVTQDVDGDGDEETIYSEGYFDVRWNSGDIPDVTLEASQIALESPLSATTCKAPGDIPCEEPEIVMAGLMPLHNPPADPIPYHDQTSGYARRPNRPHPTGGFAVPPLPSPPPANLLATAPFTDTIQLYGCNEHTGAKYYRLRYKYNASAPKTFTGHSWKVFRWVGSPGHLEVKSVSPDANGWYEVLPIAEQWLPSHLLLSWPTTGYQNGLYDVYMELGNNSKNVIHSTSEIGIRVDNTWRGNNSTSAVAKFTSLRWRHVGEGAADWQSLLVSCPVIRRDAGKDVEVEASVDVAAPHMRSILLWGSGCGGNHPQLTGALPAHWETYAGTRGMKHWHRSAFDNSFNNSLTPSLFVIGSTAQSGVYSFHLRAHSRAFNPAGSDAGFNLDWHYNPVFNRAHSDIQIAVVDA